CGSLPNYEIDTSQCKASYRRSLNIRSGKWLKQGEDSLTVKLTEVDFRIIIHDLSHGFMSKVVVRQLGNFIGNFLEYNTSTIQLGYKGIIRLRGTVKVIDQSERLIRNRSISSNGNSMNNYGRSNMREYQTKTDCQALLMRATGSDEVFKLERSRFGETPDSSMCKCGFQNGIDIDSNKRRGGLSMGWKNNCK
ncbi:hypothetical protein Godav_005698, partial [Gossypium davidsonii]|nr:hypothetical protein [Gossypium davidsonii]